jgi:hypothetical protein
VLGWRFDLWVEDSTGAARRFHDASVDAVWVDAGQSVKQVMGDIAAWWPKLWLNGAMGGCDYGLKRIRRAVKRHFGDVTFHDGAGDPESKWWLVRR